jgi:hypothetical protein
VKPKRYSALRAAISARRAKRPDGIVALYTAEQRLLRAPGSGFQNRNATHAPRQEWHTQHRFSGNTATNDIGAGFSRQDGAFSAEPIQCIGRRGFVADRFADIESFFRRSIKAMQAQSTAPRDHAAKELARLLLEVVLGIRVLARSNPEQALLKGVARPALALLD